jgi:hypothetical protein
VLAKLPPNADRATLEQVRELDRRLVGLEQNEAVRRLSIGIVAVLGRSGDQESMQYLREVFARDPARRHRDGKQANARRRKLALLIQSLSIAEGACAEVPKAYTSSRSLISRSRYARQSFAASWATTAASLRAALGEMDSQLNQPSEKPSAALAAAAAMAPPDVSQRARTCAAADTAEKVDAG